MTTHDTADKRTSAQKIGDYGESCAVEYLIAQGYQIVAKKYHSRYGEIDIIARNDEYIIFVEVKTRNQNACAQPAVWVDKRKQKKLITTAYRYLQEYDTELQPRFDVIEVTYITHSSYPPAINHIENAFIEENNYR